MNAMAWIVVMGVAACVAIALFLADYLLRTRMSVRLKPWLLWTAWLAVIIAIYASCTVNAIQSTY